MKAEKWLKRKYPENYKIILEKFGIKGVEEAKEKNYRFGILTNDLVSSIRYYAGTIFAFKGHNYMYSQERKHDRYFLFKCGKAITYSGYHGFEYFGLKNYIIIK